MVGPEHNLEDRDHEDIYLSEIDTTERIQVIKTPLFQAYENRQTDASISIPRAHSGQTVSSRSSSRYAMYLDTPVPACAACDDQSSSSVPAGSGQRARTDLERSTGEGSVGPRRSEPAWVSV